MSESSETNSFTHRPKDNFTRIDNSLMRSSALSGTAFKLHCIGMSHSGAWKFNKNQLFTCFNETRYAFDQAMKELRDQGYLHLSAINKGDGTFCGHSWHWFDNPLTKEEFKKFHRDHVSPRVGTPESPSDTNSLRRPTPKKTNKTKKKKEPSAPSAQAKPSPATNKIKKKEKKASVDLLLKNDEGLQLGKIRAIEIAGKYRYYEIHVALVEMGKRMSVRTPLKNITTFFLKRLSDAKDSCAYMEGENELNEYLKSIGCRFVLEC